MQSTGGSLALAPRMPIGNRWLREPSPHAAHQPISPFSETFVVLLVVVVCLLVRGRVVAHLKRFPDAILKALKRQGSNLSVKGKQ